MRFNKFDLNLLVALDALLTDRNTTRAAEKVHITQSAMSNALQRMREYFDDELLVRVGQRMELTPRAEALQVHVRDMLLRFEATIAVKPEFDCSQSDRQFTMLLSDFSMQVLMPRVMALAAQQGSTVRFRLLSAMQSPARLVERGEADLVIAPSGYCAPDHPTEVLFEENFVCVVWSGSKLAQQELTVERYSNAGHVVLELLEPNPPVYDTWMIQRYGFTRRVEVSGFNFTTLPYLVIGTERIATVHERLARAIEPAAPIRILPMPLPMPKMEQTMQWHTYRATDPGIQWLKDLLRKAAATLDGPYAPPPSQG